MAVIVALFLPGCGGDQAEETRLEQALATIPGKDPLGSGYGWVDVQRLREAGRPLERKLEWASDALGPDARNLARPSPGNARLGLDPLTADAMFSVTSNYALSVRLDGVDPAGIESTFRASGAQESEDNGWITFDLGSESSIPLGTTAAPLGSLAARSATKGDRIVLARRELSRSNVIGGERGPAIDVDLLAAGADCLDDVVAARFMLNNHTYLPGLGPDLLAAGVAWPPDEPAREVFCGIDEDPETVDEATRALRQSFAPGARDVIARKPIRRVFSGAEVEGFESHGLPGVRVELLDAQDVEPGELFGAFDRGSIVTYLGFQRPPLPDDLRGR